MTRERPSGRRPSRGAGSPRGWGLTARTVVVAIVVAGLVVAACSDPPSSGQEGGGEILTTGAPVTTDGSSDTTAVEGGDVVVASLVGVEVEVSNAVAPFDHHSVVDNLLLEFGLSRVRVGLKSDCLAAEGFPPIQLSPLPDRDDPILMVNRQFPYIEALARYGFPTLPGTPSSPDDFRERSEAETAASRQCAEEVDRIGHDAITAYELYASVRGPWESVLDEIDATDEIRGLVDAFGSCLRDEGIPADATASEGAFLGHVQSLLMATGVDESSWPEINERMGKLYAECGRELFEARERLRSGERREAFLREHEVAIRELSELLYDGGSSP